MKIFIDTNIFLDALLKREPFRIHADELLNLCDKRVFTAFTSCISFSNLTYFLQKFYKSGYIEALERILNAITIISLQNKDFKKALTLDYSDIEDAYQFVAASKERGMKYIITRDTNDFKKSTIPVLSAKDFLLRQV